MNKDEWNKRIEQASRNAGTYRPYFDSVIETLAGIMESRDNAMENFVSSGGETVVLYTNKGGATNIVKNPALVVVDDLNKTALAYWRDLGLTPAGLKRINDMALKEPDGKESFEDILSNLGI